MNRIFINYRRTESQFVAGALARELRKTFGERRVFRDQEDIRGGVAWSEYLLGEIAGDSAVLVLIGRGWAQTVDSQGRRRLDLPDDPVRLEIADGLRDRAFVLPILLEDATMPQESDLPADIRKLAGLNALRLRDTDWHHDSTAICDALKQRGFRKGRFPARLAWSWFLNIFVLIMLAAPDNTHDKAVGLAFWCVVALILAFFAWRQNKSIPRTRWWAWSSLGLTGALVIFSGIASAIW